MSTANVINVSEGAGLIDFASLKSQGIKAVVIRIGHGVIQDADAAGYIRSAANSGLVVHAYHQLEEVDDEVAWSLANVEKLLVTGAYYFLDVSHLRIDCIADVFRGFYRNWLQAGYKVGIRCTTNQLTSLANVDFKSMGIYRWTTSHSEAADLWQIDSDGQDKLGKNVDQTGLLIKAVEQDSHVTDPNKDYQVKAGAFVGFDYSTTNISGGKMLVSSPDGVNKIPKLGPDGSFIFNEEDADRLWAFLKPKIEDLIDEKLKTLKDGGEKDSTK